MDSTEKLLLNFLAKRNLDANKVCSCGISIKEVIKTGKLGCPSCYQTFNDILKVFIEQMNCNHLGKKPKKKLDDAAIEILEQEAIKAAMEGRFDDAHIIKKDIKRLRG